MYNQPERKNISVQKAVESVLNQFVCCAGVCQLCQATDRRGRGRHVAQADGRWKKRHQDLAYSKENMNLLPVNAQKQRLCRAVW